MGHVCGDPLGVVNEEEPQLAVLGVIVDGDLTFAPQLARVRARVREAARQVFGAAQSTGFGLPYQIGQWESRVVSKAIFGVEFTASFHKGWREAGRRLTRKIVTLAHH